MPVYRVDPDRGDHLTDEPDPDGLLLLADEARRILESASPDGGGRAAVLIAQGLSLAYLRGDSRGLAAMIQVVTHLFEDSGRFDSALQELGVVSANLTDASGPRALILGLQANLYASLGRKQEAVAAIANALECFIPTDEEWLGARVQSLVAGAQLQTLTVGDEAHMSLTIEALGRLKPAREWLYALSWYIPWLAARGDWSGVRARLRSFEARAMAEEHAWRLEDAKVASDAVADIIGGSRERLDGVEWTSPLAQWRHACLDLRFHLLRRDDSSIERSLARLEGTEARMRDVYVGDRNAFRTTARAFQGASLDKEPRQYARPQTLLSALGASFATAEAVAVAGNRSMAEHWRRWCGSRSREGIHSCLEWPALLPRLEALLMIRCGNWRLGVRRNREAIELARRQGFEIEGALAVVVRDTVLAHAQPMLLRPDWRDSNATARHYLEANGIDNRMPELWALDALEVGRKHAGTLLSQREAEVLGHLAQGHTYHEIAAAMSLTVGSVHTLTHRLYEKLDASGRAEAVATGQRLGLI